jgi:hypothetical protein
LNGIRYHKFTWFATILTRRVSLEEQELLTLPEHLSSSPIFSGVRVTRSLVLYVCFVDHCLSFCTFSFGHCVVCSSVYGIWFPLWYFQTLLQENISNDQWVTTTFSWEYCYLFELWWRIFYLIPVFLENAFQVEKLLSYPFVVLNNKICFN